MGSAVVHFEIGCRDKAGTAAFYSKLFDWGIESSGPADMINTGNGEGICGHISALGHEPHNYVTVYAEVEDIPRYLAQAEALGGKVVIPETEVPQAGHFAWLSDPEGTIIGLWKPMAAR
ncbi:MAG: VOC family protein [Planctomycetota bacterium]|jgi:predicted enzyme related to lactoylglutathione lyase